MTKMESLSLRMSFVIRFEQVSTSQLKSYLRCKPCSFNLFRLNPYFPNRFHFNPNSASSKRVFQLLITHLQIIPDASSSPSIHHPLTPPPSSPIRALSPTSTISTSDFPPGSSSFSSSSKRTLDDRTDDVLPFMENGDEIAASSSTGTRSKRNKKNKDSAPSDGKGKSKGKSLLSN